MSRPEIIRPEDIRLLTEIGFMGIGSGRLDEAARIFSALAAWRPGRDFPWIGQALCLYARGQNHHREEAIRLLSGLQLDNAEDHANIQSFLGFLLQQSGESGRAHALLQQAANSQAAASGLANALLAPNTAAQNGKKTPSATLGALV